MMTDVDSAIRFIVAALLSGLWQAPLFALAAWLVLRVRPNANATTRHSVLAAALFASLILPVVTATLTSNPAPGGTSAVFAAGGTSHVSSAAHGVGDALVPKNILPYKPLKLGASLPSRTSPTESTPPPLFTVPALARLSLSLPRTIALALVAIWFAGAGFVLLRLIVSLAHLERLKRDALPLPVEYRAELTRWATAAKGSRTVRLCTSDEIEIPIAVGLFDAMILVPTRLLEELEPHDVDSIVLHELAHLRRADDWVNAIERFSQAFLFFNPGILWLNAQLDLEREVACDDWVLQQNDALPYATCLAKVVETTVWPFRAMTAPGAFVTRRGMSIRIERLLAKHRDVRVRTSAGPAGAVVGMLAVLGIVAAFVSPSIAYSVTQPKPAQPASVAQPTSGTDMRAHVERSQVASGAAYSARAASTAPLTAAKPAYHPTAPAAPVSPQKWDAEAASGSASGSSSASSDSNSDSDADSNPPPAHPRGAHAHAHPHPVANPTFSLDLDEVIATAAKTAAAARTSVSESVAVTPDLPKVPEVNEPLDHPEIVAEANAPDYIDELASVGYTKLSVDELVQMKAVGVTASFIRDLQAQGIAHPSISDLVAMRAVGVDPSFIGAMRRHYGNSVSLGDIVGMRAVGVTSDYIDQLSSLGYKNLNPEKVRSLRALGVTPGYVHDLQQAGYTNLTSNQVQQLKALGVDRDFISRAAAHGFHDLTVEQLISLRATGVL
jgi:beta-lactamase regulating signal transducer with metallopeptidase domain